VPPDEDAITAVLAVETLVELCDCLKNNVASRSGVPESRPWLSVSDSASQEGV
jgi:hypothetical protein